MSIFPTLYQLLYSQVLECLSFLLYTSYSVLTGAGVSVFPTLYQLQCTHRCWSVCLFYSSYSVLTGAGVSVFPTLYSYSVLTGAGVSVFPTLVIVYSQVLECLSFLLYTSYSVLTGAGVSVCPALYQLQCTHRCWSVCLSCSILVIVYSQVLECLSFLLYTSYSVLTGAGVSVFPALYQLQCTHRCWSVCLFYSILVIVYSQVLECLSFLLYTSYSVLTGTGVSVFPALYQLQCTHRCWSVCLFYSILVIVYSQVLECLSFLLYTSYSVLTGAGVSVFPALYQLQCTHRCWSVCLSCSILVIVYSQVLECLSFLLYTSYSVLTGAGVSVFPTLYQLQCTHRCWSACLSYSILVIVYSQVLECLSFLFYTSYSVLTGAGMPVFPTLYQLQCTHRCWSVCLSYSILVIVYSQVLESLSFLLYTSYSVLTGAGVPVFPTLYQLQCTHRCWSVCLSYSILVIVYSQVLECLSFLLYTSYSVLTGAGVSVFPTLYQLQCTHRCWSNCLFHSMLSTFDIKQSETVASVCSQ